MNIQASNFVKNTPPYAAAETDKLRDGLRAKGIHAIDFGVGDPTSPVPDFVINRLCEAAKENAATGYPSYIGMKKFREAAARYMQRRFGVSLNPETEITSNLGGKEAVFHFPFGVVNPGDLVIIPTPGYPPMTTGTKYAGGIPYFVGLFEENDFLIDYESIPEEIANKAVMMWLNYPNSPTGKAAPLEYYQGLHAWAQKHNIILAADEGCYIDIFFHGKTTHSLLEVSRDGVLVFYSLSKRNNMTGLRVGFVAGDERLVSIFKKVKTNIDSGTPNCIQEAAIVALDDDTHIEKMRAEYLEKQTIMLKTFESLGFPITKPDATFYIWQKAPHGMNGVEFVKKLLSDDLAIVGTPGGWLSTEESIYGKNPGENFVRFALMPSKADVEEACRRLHKYF